MAEENLWNERMRSNGWRKFLKRWGQMVERQRKVFEWMRSNGWTAGENFWMDEVERLNSWGKFLNGWGWMAEWLRKVFQQMRSKGWMAEENFWMAEVERLTKFFSTTEVERLNGCSLFLCCWIMVIKYFQMKFITMNNGKVKLCFLSENWLNWKPGIKLILC